MANVRASNKCQVSLWLTKEQRAQLKKVASAFGFEGVTELFSAIADGEVGIDLRPKRARGRLQLVSTQEDLYP